MSNRTRTNPSFFNSTPYGRLAERSTVPGCRRPTIAEALAEIASR